MTISCGDLLDQVDQAEQQFEAFCGKVRDHCPDNTCRLVAYALSRGFRRSRAIVEGIAADSLAELRAAELPASSGGDLSVNKDLVNTPLAEVAPAPFLAGRIAHLTALVEAALAGSLQAQLPAARELFEAIADAEARELRRVKAMSEVPDFSKGREEPADMNAFELSIPAETDLLDLEQVGIGGALLLENAQWFVKLRWLVMALLALSGLAMIFAPEFVHRIGLPDAGTWLVGMASGLCVANLIFTWHVNRLGEDNTRSQIALNIWVQIIVDLVIVTVMVHVIGSTGTFIGFTYLFHIVLACIFFHPRKSLLLTIVAAGLYWSCVLLEHFDVLHPPGSTAFPNGPVKLFTAFCTVGVWAVVWYLTSSLSGAVRRRDKLLNKANLELRKANEEKNRLVLIAAHDLKAPLAGVRSNINVLKVLHWEETPEAVRSIIDRLEIRGETLTRRIQDILALGNLRPTDDAPPENQPVELGQVLATVKESLQSRADGRSVELDFKCSDKTIVFGDESQIRLLVDNLVSNAISYSHEGGTVKVSVKNSSETGTVMLSVADRGIGIPEAAMGKIFDEYFRTKEANRFNRMSTGLGLAIVRQVARNLDLRVRVRSKEGHGTTFEIIFPQTKKQG